MEKVTERDITILARQLRLATVQNLYRQGLLTEEGAKEVLAGPLTPEDLTTVYDDSGLLNDSEGLLKIERE